MQSLKDSYEYYLNAMIDSQSVLDSMQSTEKITTSSSSQGMTRLFSFQYDSVYRCLFHLAPLNKSDENIIFENCSDVNIEVMRTAFNLHKQGLMMPWIFQCLYKVGALLHEIHVDLKWNILLFSMKLHFQ